MLPYFYRASQLQVSYTRVLHIPIVDYKNTMLCKILYAL